MRRSGRVEVRERVARLMSEGRAAWCDMVALELWNGARGGYEREQLQKLGQELVLLPTTDLAWSKAKALADRCRSTGNTVPATDLIIAACALVHGANVEHCDAHLAIITELARNG